MSKTSETSKLSRAILENRDLVADSDLDAVTGGRTEVNHSEFAIVKLCDAATPK
jgi:hypothetical protein